MREWLHRPFACFGDRTAFARFRTPLSFFPTDRALEPGMPFILDCAPVVDGCAADVGYTSWLDACPIAERVLDDLAAHRALIVSQVPERPLGEVYDAVVALARRQGYEIRHRAYPFGVLGHRVERLAPATSRLSRAVGPVTVAAFGLRRLAALGGLARRGELALWNDRFAASRPFARSTTLASAPPAVSSRRRPRSGSACSRSTSVASSPDAACSRS